MAFNYSKLRLALNMINGDQSGICRQEENVSESTVSSNIPHTWKYSTKCKPLTESKVSSILDFHSLRPDS